MKLNSDAFRMACRKPGARAAIAVCGVLLGSACRSRSQGTQDPSTVPDSPQAVLEQQLLTRQHKLNRRTADGGMVYNTDISATSSESMRVPYDLLKLECESHGGELIAHGPPEKTAASLAQAAPEPLQKLLVDADQRNVFGLHDCEAGGVVWSAELQPVSLNAVSKSDRYQFELYVRAELNDDYDPDAPSGPGLPQWGGAPPSAAGTSGGSGSASTEPAPATANSSPLDPRPSRPAAPGDAMLADPRPFGLTAGADAPETVAQRLGLALDQAQHCDKAGLKGYCWQKPGSSEAVSLTANFAELGANTVLAELEVHYPASSYAWLSRTLINTLGPTDTPDSADHSQSWNWLHTTVQLTLSGGDTRVSVVHKPSLDRAKLKKGTPARDQNAPARIATPWQLQLGYEAAQAAQTKLQTAGFTISDAGCSDSGQDAKPVFTRTCALTSGGMPGVRSAWVRAVDIGDGRPRLAELGYQLDPKGWNDTLRDLKAQYGEPIPSEGGALQWWTGQVGVTLTPATKDAPTLRYYHGRLLQYFIVAEAKRRGSDKAQQRQGL